MKKNLLTILTIIATLSLTACDEVTLALGLNNDSEFLAEILGQQQQQMKAIDVEFAPDYKTFTMTTDILQDIGAYKLEDSTKVRTEVLEIIDGIRSARLSIPSLTEIENIEATNISKQKISLLVLVNRTLPQTSLDRIRTYVDEMTTVFNHDNLFVAFMDSGSVSNTMPVTDYVLTNNFNRSSRSAAYLYRSILEKRTEMIKGDGIWQDSRSRFLLIFSDEKVYDDASDEPIDPNHYQYEEQMVARNTAMSDTIFKAFYSSIASRRDINNGHEANVLRLFCNNSGGDFIEDFHWVTCKEAMLHTLHLSFPDYKFHFENPDYKVYRGDDRKLTLNFYDQKKDSLIASVSTTITKGNLFDPIIVHAHSIGYVAIQGLLIGLLILLLVYLILQFVVPYIRYRYFLHKYVIHYTGQHMSFANKTVEESCYLCKSPFEVDDDIVVKCEHTMHKECWDENNYHCPEYSDRCHHGSHYYNAGNLSDPCNASFYLKWMVMAIIASTLSWLTFILYAHYTQLSELHSAVTQVPTFGLAIGFFLTFGISILTLRPANDYKMLRHILLRACLAAVGCYLTYMLVNLIIYLFDINSFTFMLNWIPWTVSGFIIAYCSTFATRIVHNRLLLFVCVLLGFLSMYVWTILFSHMELDFRVLLLFSFIIYGVGLAACIATVAPKSERYFLKVHGATKGLDIALYKWFRNNPGRIVTIGKSVDCSLQLVWDIQSDIAPVQAEIRLIKNAPYLNALEPGVFIKGESLPIDKKKRLYHGDSFDIGQTTFTYIEKDR